MIKVISRWGYGHGEGDVAIADGNRLLAEMSNNQAVKLIMDLQAIIAENRKTDEDFVKWCERNME